jgi:(S)-ureidoglycine-glyoxylate aminotransferase
MGPGPVNADPRVLQAMSLPLLGQFDPDFTRYMNEVMALYRGVFQTENHWSFVINGTARAGIEAILTSIITPGDRVLVPVAGRFGQLLCEIAERCRAEVRVIERPWGEVFPADQIEDAIKTHDPKLVAAVHGDTSTTMAQPLREIGEVCRRYDRLLYADATATLGGMDFPVDAWKIDAASAGLQKCMSGPPGTAPITFNERVAQVVLRRKHIEQGIRPEGFNPGDGEMIQSNYFDLPMLMDYWSESRLNHHTEATSALYAARECARVVMAEGLEARFARHERVSRALSAGLQAMGLKLFGDQAHKMLNVTGVEVPDGIDAAAGHHGPQRPQGRGHQHAGRLRSGPPPPRPRHAARRRGRCGLGCIRTGGLRPPEAGRSIPHDELAGVGADDLAGDHVGVGAGEPDDGVGDIDRLA